MSTVPAHVKCDYSGCDLQWLGSGTDDWYHVLHLGNPELDFCSIEHLEAYGNVTPAKVIKPRTLRRTNQGTTPRFSEAEAEKMIEMYTDNVPVTDIAKKFDCTPSTIYKYLKLAE